MNNYRLILQWFWVPILLLFFLSANSQTGKTLLLEMAEEEQAAVNALVLYPKDTRMAILEASLYPEALIKLENIQSQTTAAFRKILENHSRATQEIIWDLTRYPDLIHRLTIVEKGSTSGLNNALDDYPKVIHPRAEKAFTYYYSDLKKVDALNESTDSAVNTLLSEYPKETQLALRELIALPEVLTILTENIRLTILVGDLFRKDSEWVLYKADSLHLEAARKNAEEIEAWKESLADNPQAMEELKTSAESFAEEHDYKDEYYSFEGDDLYYDAEIDYVEEDYYVEETKEVVIRHHYYHFPYWFGYPYWYHYPRWRFFPNWYHWGFYYSPHHTVVVFGLPSFYFTNWYFYHPHHHYYWSHLSAHFSNHYYGHRSMGSSITTSVSTWRDQNKEVVTNHWLQDDGRLPQRFKEYGRFESSRIRHNREHPGKTLSKTAYAERYSKRYPELSKSVERIKAGTAIHEEPLYKPRTEPPVYEPDMRQPTIPKTNKQGAQKNKKITLPSLNKGKEYHKNTWEQSKSSRNKVTKSKTPIVKKLPRTKTTKPKVRAPKTKTKTKTKSRKN